MHHRNQALFSSRTRISNIPILSEIRDHQLNDQILRILFHEESMVRWSLGSRELPRTFFKTLDPVRNHLMIVYAKLMSKMAHKL